MIIINVEDSCATVYFFVENMSELGIDMYSSFEVQCGMIFRCIWNEEKSEADILF